MFLSNKITYIPFIFIPFHSFIFKTSNQGYLIPFHFILFHSFPLFKYISFHSFPFPYYYFILFHSLPLWTPKWSLKVSLIVSMWIAEERLKLLMVTWKDHPSLSFIGGHLDKNIVFYISNRNIIKEKKKKKKLLEDN